MVMSSDLPPILRRLLKILFSPWTGIIILNIMSWGSGANAWGPEKEDKFTKPNHWDGMLEVVGVQGVVHLGQIQSGLRSAIRIVQVTGYNQSELEFLKNLHNAKL